MTVHHTKQANRLPSQIFPSAIPKMASDVTLADTYVLLCDWRGHVVWKSGTGDRVIVGDEIWKNIASRSKELLRTAIASVVTLKESHTLEVECERKDHFRMWMWPLHDPEIALCILARRIPSELALLTDRETACLRCLAQGMSTKDISKRLNIGLTTVHTHLRRSREKLGLATGEALIGFAARYFFVPEPTETIHPAVACKRSG